MRVYQKRNLFLQRCYYSLSRMLFSKLPAADNNLIAIQSNVPSNLWLTLIIVSTRAERAVHNLPYERWARDLLSVPFKALLSAEGWTSFRLHLPCANLYYRNTISRLRHFSVTRHDIQSASCIPLKANFSVLELNVSDTSGKAGVKLVVRQICDIATSSCWE